MSILNLVYLIPVLLATCSTQHTQVFANHVLQNSGTDSYFRNLPCPNAEDIAPCICHVYAGYLHMNCTGITDEQELYNVFHADLPDPTFWKLTLGNDHLETLNDTVFGDATFEEVRFKNKAYPGTLTSVGPETFIKSASTLIVLDLSYNQLTDFPFETLSQYTKLREFNIKDNTISSFPMIESETLMALNVGGMGQEYETIPAGALDSLPNLVSFNAKGATIKSMPTGLFTSLPKLMHIDMSGTELTHLKSLQFGVNRSAVVDYIYLDYNMITTVEVDAFKGVQSGEISLWNNLLTTLPEAKWRPLLDAGVKLLLSGNYLVCGCDVAWIVMEPAYHDLLPDARCYLSGELIVELDPSGFVNCTDEVIRL